MTVRRRHTIACGRRGCLRADEGDYASSPLPVPGRGPQCPSRPAAGIARWRPLVLPSDYLAGIQYDRRLQIPQVPGLRQETLRKQRGSAIRNHEAGGWMKGRRGENAPAAAVARAERTQPNGKTQGQWKRTGCGRPPILEVASAAPRATA